MSIGTDTLVEYGHGFQTKSIASLFNIKYLSTVQDIAIPEMFTTEAHQWIVKNIVAHFRKFKTIPSNDIFKSYIVEDDLSEVQQSLIEMALQEITSVLTSTDLPAIQVKFKTFCLNQEIKNGLSDSIDYLKAGKYDKIRTRMGTALRADKDADLGLNFKDDIDVLFDEAVRNTIPTPWDVINEIAQGGFAGGELIVLVAGPGGGKSMSLVNIAAHAAAAGKKVVYYTLELNRAYVGLRFCSYYLRLPVPDLKYHKDQIKSKVGKLLGNIVIKYWPTKSASLSNIEAHIESITANGFKPDIVVVDYADLLRIESSSANGRHDQDLGNLYAELRGLAGQLDIPIYTASQANRCLSIDTMVQEETKGSIRIIDLNIGDKILTHDGYKNVSAIYPTTKQPVYKIRLKSGKEIICSSKHEFPVKYGKLKSIQTGLKPGDQLLTQKKS